MGTGYNGACTVLRSLMTLLMRNVFMRIFPRIKSFPVSQSSNKLFVFIVFFFDSLKTRRKIETQFLDFLVFEGKSKCKKNFSKVKLWYNIPK